MKHYISDLELDVLIITENSKASDLAFLKVLPSLLGKKQVTVHLKQPPEVSTRLNDFDIFWPNSVLWKLFIPMEYPEYDKILYLDNDTVIYRDISELFSLISNEHPIAAVPDYYFYVQTDTIEFGPEFGLKTTKSYINVGVVVFNVSVYNMLFEVGQIVEAINNCSYQFPEQTILNNMCEDHITLLPLEYNYQKNDDWLFGWARHASPVAALDIIEARENIAIRHFVGYGNLSMPWEHLFVENQQEMDFWNYLYEVKQLYVQYRDSRY